MAVWKEFSRSNVTPFKSQSTDVDGNLITVEGTVTVELKAKPIVGAAAGGKNPAESLLNYNALDFQVGPLALRRSYAQPKDAVPSTVANTTMMADMLAHRASLWSFKASPFAFAAGQHDAAFKSLLGTIEHNALITLWHEPGSEFKANAFTPQQWKAAINRMGMLIHNSGYTDRIKSYICLEGWWAFQKPNGFGAFDYWDAGFAETVDYIGFDSYARSGNNHVQDWLTNKLASMTEAPVDWARRHGKRMIVPEWGVSDSYGQGVKSDLMQSFWDWAVAQPDVDAVSYFHNNQEVLNQGDPSATYEVHDDSLLALRSIVEQSRS